MTKRKYVTRVGAVLNLGLLLAACSVTEGPVTLVGGPPRVAVVNAPPKPSKVIEGVMDHVADGDCWVLTDAHGEKQYAVAWPANSEGGYSANEKPGVHLDSGIAVMSGDGVIASGEVDLPGSKQAEVLPELSPLCGAEDGGWLLISDIEVEG